MRANRGVLVVALALLAACQPRGSFTSPRPRASVHTAAQSAPPASTSPDAASPVTGGQLLPPTKIGATLAGTLRIDAAYAVSSGAAIIANNGGGLIGKVKGADLVSDHGAGIVANNAGNIIANNAGSLISDHGLGLVGDAAAGLIGKVKLLGDQGGSLIGKTKYALADAKAPAAGTALPAANMLVGVVSLADGQPVPIGRDAAGNPAFAVLTDARGGFKLYLPPGLAGNVRLVARPVDVSDPRLEFGAVLPPSDAADLQLDDANALAAAYLRVVMVGRIDDLLLHDDGDPARTANALGKLPALLQGQAGGVVAAIQATARANGVKDLPAPQRRAVILGAADALASTIDLTKLGVDVQRYGEGGDGLLALPTMAKLIADIDARAAKILANNKRYFDDRPYMVAVNRERRAAGRLPFRIEKPSDVAALVVGEFLASNDGTVSGRADGVLVDLGLAPADRRHLVAATAGIFEALGFQLVGSADAQAAVNKAIATYAAAAKATPPEPSPTPRPDESALPPVPSPPAVTVSTIAGDGTNQSDDGTGTQAHLANPIGLVLDLDAASPTFYVADAGSGRLRRVVVDASGQATVTTLAGIQLKSPWGLALGHDHRLYVADHDDQRIRMVDLSAATLALADIAGTGTAGFADGPGAQAKFDRPQALGFDHDGNLLVGEEGDARIRRIDLVDAAHPVTTVLGTGVAGSDDGPAAQATLSDAAGFALGPDGTVYFSDMHGGRIRKWTPDGVVSLVAGGYKSGFADGLWSDAGFYGPTALWLADNGWLYVVDRDNSRIRIIEPPGDVVTLAGGGGAGIAQNPILGAFADGSGAAARFNLPMGLVGDAAGNLYVTDQFGNRLRKIAPR